MVVLIDFKLILSYGVPLTQQINLRLVLSQHNVLTSYGSP
jgi:hypothetical protein